MSVARLAVPALLIGTKLATDDKDFSRFIELRVINSRRASSLIMKMTLTLEPDVAFELKRLKQEFPDKPFRCNQSHCLRRKMLPNLRPGADLMRNKMVSIISIISSVAFMILFS